MKKFNIDYIIWNNEGNSDKLWGFVTIPNDSKTYNFWGRRGKKYSFKEFEGTWTYRNESLGDAKIRKGYRKISQDDIETLMPGFTDEFTDQLFIAKMFDNFHGKSDD